MGKKKNNNNSSSKKEEAKDDLDKEDGEEEVAELEPKQPHEPFSIAILGLIWTQRYQNGLRHNDHYRYRQYCSRRVRHLRIVLMHKCGRGRYKDVPFPEDFGNSKFVDLLIVYAERCWAHAMLLKADIASAMTTVTARWRLHMLKRLAKARKWAQKLNEVAANHCDQRTIQEAKAYCAYIEAAFFLEREEWEEALMQLNQAKSFYERLGVACVDPKDQQAYKETVQELEPSFRIANYHLGNFGEEKEQAKAKKKGSDSASSDFLFRGAAVSVPSEEIKKKMANARELLLQVDETQKAGDNVAARVELYGQASVAIAETITATHNKLIDADDDADWVRVEACMREFQCCLCLERNAILLLGVCGDRKGKPEEGIRFCDSINADLAQLVNLPETKEQFRDAISMYEKVAQNARAFFLAQCHFIMGKYLEAAALLNLMKRLDKDQDLPSLHQPLNRITPFFEDVNLNTHLGASRLYVNVLVALYKSKTVENEKEDGGTTKALTATFPPQPSEVEAKPLVLDLSFFEMEKPDLSKYVKKGVVGKLAGALGGWGTWRSK